MKNNIKWFASVIILLILGCSSNRLSSEDIAMIKRGVIFSVHPIQRSSIPTKTGLNFSDSLNTQFGESYIDGMHTRYCYLSRPGFITIIASTGDSTYTQLFDSLANGYYKIKNENPILFIQFLKIRANNLDLEESSIP